jgi:hypothetical protein
VKEANLKKRKGLEAWLPPEGAPHIHAYSNLLRMGVPEKKARKIIEKALIKCGLAKKEDFKNAKIK